MYVPAKVIWISYYAKSYNRVVSSNPAQTTIKEPSLMSAPVSVPDEFSNVNRVFETEVVASGNFAAIGHVYTKTARILPPGAETITGLEHIAAFWKDAISVMGVQSIKLSTIDLEMLDNTAVEVGRAELGTAHPASPTVVKYVVVWKQEEGAWKWDIDIWNAAS